MWLWIKRCLGGKAKETNDTPALRYQGYDIVAAPVVQGGQYRISGEIRQLAEEGHGSIPFDRADTFPDREMAVRMTQLKARQFIDQQGGPLF